MQYLFAFSIHKWEIHRHAHAHMHQPIYIYLLCVCVPVFRSFMDQKCTYGAFTASSYSAIDLVVKELKISRIQTLFLYFLYMNIGIDR